jgi:endonuclease III
MANSPNRAALLTKAHKVLKKHYKPVNPAAERPLMEQLLFALCLENSTYEAAEQAYAALEANFFDWNEIRVTTVKELSESMTSLPDAAAAATNLRRALQSVFESNYSYEIESLRKQNLGQAVAKLQSIAGVSPFAVAYMTQAGLGGHSIPLDRGALWALQIVGIINEAEQEAGHVPGMERTIPKNKGIEFGSLLHQLGADLIASPYSTNVHNILVEISPEAKAHLPKRQAKKKEDAPAEPAPPQPAVAKKQAAVEKPASAPAPEPEKPAAAKKKEPVKEPPKTVEAAKTKTAKPAAKKPEPPDAKKKASPVSKPMQRKPR